METGCLSPSPLHSLCSPPPARGPLPSPGCFERDAALPLPTARVLLVLAFVQCAKCLQGLLQLLLQDSGAGQVKRPDPESDLPSVIL